MTNSDPFAFIKAILAKDFEAARHRAAHHAKRSPIVITLSRDHGALGEEVARLLANCLGIPLYDQEILDLVAASSKIDQFRLQAHDENPSAGLTAFLYGILTGSDGEKERYRQHLCEVVAKLGQGDGLLIGRGTHLILNRGNAFRVRIVGSRLICAQRIEAAEGLSIQQAEARFDAINSKRHWAVQNLFADQIEHASLEHAANFDLVINTDHLSPEAAVGLILLGLEQSGFDIQARLAAP